MPKEDNTPTESNEPDTLEQYSETEQLREQIQDIAPSAFSEGEFVPEKLARLLGQSAPDTANRYDFQWAGKQDALNEIQEGTRKTLQPNKEKSIEYADTDNLFVEGDNLDVLRTLQKSYRDAVKMIYIDPPYNTGNDFIYKDAFHETAKEYKQKTGQYKDGEGRLVANPETNGRFHSDWLSMMYPRLMLARNLLQEDGVAFISIDENEVVNLRMLMNEIFGEENFICQFIWNKRPGGRGGDIVNTIHEYVLLYAKDINNVSLNDRPKSDDKVANNYRHEDGKGRYKRRPLRQSGHADRREDRPTMYYPVTSPNGDEIYPTRPDGNDGRWVFGENRFNQLDDSGNVEFVENSDGWKVYWKERPYDENGERKTEKYKSILEGVPYTEEGESDIEELSPDLAEAFSYPKPVGLIKRFVEMGSSPGDIVLDFFAGSGTTAQAVMELNEEDEGTRDFILVQLPEEVEDHSEYEYLSDFCLERVKRVSQQIREEAEGDNEIDRGVKFLSVGDSNFPQWSRPESETELRKELRSQSDLTIDVTPEAALLEVSLLEGFTPNAKVTTETLGGVDYHLVSEGGQQMVVVFDNETSQEHIAELVDDETTPVVCLDRVLSDTQKDNLARKYNLKVM